MAKTLLIILILFSVLSIETYSKPWVKGKITSISGQTVPTAAVMIEGSGGQRTRPIAAQADSLGNYLLDIPGDGLHRIEFSGINHESISLPLFCKQDDDTLEINVALAPFQFDPAPILVGLIGNFNNFSLEEGVILLDKEPSGVYSTALTMTSDTLYYQIVGLVKGKLINGTMGNYHLYKSHGEYVSVMISKDKKVRFAYDPRMVQMQYKPAKVTSPSKDLNQYLETADKVKDIQSNFSKKFKEAGYDKTSKPILKEIEEIFDNMDSWLSKEKNERAKQMLLVEYGNLIQAAIFFGKKDLIEKKYVTELTEKIPANSSVWKRYANFPSNIFKILGEESSKPFFERLFAANTDEMYKKMIEFNLQSIRLYNNIDNENFVQSALSSTEFPDNMLYEAVKYAFEDEGNIEKGKKLLKILYEKYPDSASTVSAKYEFDPDRAIQVGKSVPSFNLTDLDNSARKITPEAFKGKFVLIDIWATWCGPCLGEMGNLHKVYEKFKDKKLEILSISFDKSSDLVQKFRQGKWKMPWVHTFSEGIFNSEIAKQFEVLGIPRPLLIDPNGKIIAMENELRGENLEKTLDQLIK